MSHFDINRVILTGRLGAHPELKKSVHGIPFTKLSLAQSWLAKNGERAVQWHQVMVWGSQAELCCQYLRKGSSILVDGHLEVRTQEFEEGQKKRSLFVQAQRVQFLGGMSERKSFERKNYRKQKDQLMDSERIYDEKILDQEVDTDSDFLTKSEELVAS